ncbi:MAG: hypothetical protein CMP59_06860 [Flavobacteriales bacterium]|nr:hypothetical protein [Flavobacteriales bacterium]|tara:strand:- start:165 stop:668 length:504 start_codon:yes stop_codon:yes gene_type:complete
MNLKYILLLFSTIPIFCYAQEDPYESWNKNYKEIDVKEILIFEDEYADSIETHSTEHQQMYFRQDGYRFNARYSGNWRKVSKERKEALATCFKIFGFNSEVINILNKEVEIETNYGSIWMPIQDQLIEPLKDEAEKNSDVYFYTLFINYHDSEAYNNLFIISEFTAN